MKIKQGVRLLGVHPAVILAAGIVDEVFNALAGHGVTITGGIEGSHSRSSLHYIGHAMDFRTRRDGIDKTLANQIANELRARMPTDFDVIVHETHIHLEWQPHNNYA